MASTLRFIILTGMVLTMAIDTSFGQAIEMCYRCNDVDYKSGGLCMKDMDFCDGHERCLLMHYKGSNGNLVYEAKCSHTIDCDTKDAKIALCDKKDKCEIDHCCKGNMCNTASGSWLRVNIQILFVFVFLSTYLLFKR